MRHYETIGGQVTRGETFAKLTELLREAEDCANVLAHLHNTEGNDADKLFARGWLQIGQLLARMRVQITNLAMGKLQ